MKQRQTILDELRKHPYDKQFRLAMDAACKTLQIKPAQVTEPKSREWAGLFARWAIIDVLSDTMGFQAPHILAKKLNRDRSTIANAKRNYRQSDPTRERFKPYFKEFLRKLGRAL